MKSRVIVNRNYLVDKIDNRIYSGFVEHLGRAVYEGIYQPGHPSADEDGFMRLVLLLSRASHGNRTPETARRIHFRKKQVILFS